MKFGGMNSPLNPLLDEMKYFAKTDFDFVELPIEPPLTDRILSNKKETMRILNKYKLVKIVHSPSYVFTANLSETIRKASQKDVLESFDLASEFGIKKVVIHPSYITGLGSFMEKKVKEIGYDFLATSYDKSKELGIALFLENMMPTEGWLFQPEEFRSVFRDFKKMKLLLDIGHANVMTKENISLKFIKLFKKRIGHIHVSDNFGDSDDHLPLGCGKIKFNKIFSFLKRTGYDETMTLEVFPRERDYLILSLQKAKELWKKA